MNDGPTINALFENYAANYPEHLAVISEDHSYTYQTLNENANQLAHYLKVYQLSEDSIIAIAFNRSPEMLIAILAILKIGCAYLPIDANHPQERLQYILKDSMPALLITQSEHKNSFTNQTNLLILDEIANTLNHCAKNNLSLAQSNHLAYVIYTSGSTGVPKGTLIEHQSVVNYAQWFSEYSGVLAQDRIDFTAHIIFDMAVTSTIVALGLGLQIVIGPEDIRKNTKAFLQFLKNNKVNVTKLTPSYLKALHQEVLEASIELPHLKAIILGGEALSTKTCSEWLSRYPNHILFNEYGPTEATVAVTQFKVTQKNVHTLSDVVPIGKPPANVCCEIINEKNNTCGPLEIGELYIYGTCLARGYLNQPLMTQKQFVKTATSIHGKCYKTGDLCRYLADGNIEFVKRVDDQIKIRGFRIELAEVMNALNHFPNILESLVIVHETGNGEKNLIAYYVHDVNRDVVDPLLLRQYLRQRLPEYMVPALFMPLAQFPLNDNGKLDKKSLPAPHFKSTNYPEGPLEQQLVRIWQKAFGLSDIGMDSNFFELGGHSLIAVKIVREIENHIGKKISVEKLYEAPTILKLLAELAFAEVAALKQVGPKKIKSIKGIMPLADFQSMFWLLDTVEPKIKNLNIIARRRIKGKLDSAVLELALNHVFQKHEILNTKVGKYLPVLYLNKTINANVITIDLSNLSKATAETELSNSLDQLIKFSEWKKNRSLIMVKLFHLPNNTSELQIGVSHIGFDDASEKIFFTDLSEAYLHYQMYPKPNLKLTKVQFNDYVSHERAYLNQKLNEDIAFWRKYFENTALLELPEKEILTNMENVSYSTYLDLPNHLLKNIQKMSVACSATLTDIFCAVILQSLQKLGPGLNRNIFINTMRSLREHDAHDALIGCFLRLDSFKMDLAKVYDLQSLSYAVQQAKIKTENHQLCSGLIKLACLNKTYQKKFIKNFFANFFASLYCKLFPKLQLNPQILTMYPRIYALRSKKHFMLNINVLNNLVSSPNNKQLFGHEIENTHTHQYDLSNINNILEICWLRNESMNQSHLVISGNLTPQFREKMGKEIIASLEKINIENKPQQQNRQAVTEC